MQSIENIDFKTLTLLTAEQAHKYRVIPAGLDDGTLTGFSPEGQNTDHRALSFLLGKKIRLESVPIAQFDRQLARYYPFNKAQSTRARADLREDSDIIRFVRKIMQEAVGIGASDIHIERYETYARVRFRWEGQLLEKYEVPPSQYNAIVNRIKILAELDIAERRLPQDGRINLNLHNQKIDVRVSTVPGKFGEKVVMRLLSRSPSFLHLENLGMHTDELERFTTALKSPNGIVLITGPTGSGKTTTLYAALSLLNTAQVNISTIEDPIEYNIEGINQVQVKEDIGMSFGNALRAFLRQDPDIMMVGEIRDRETAEISIRAALTGHLVFSTLHTNSAWDAVTRLIDMGVEPYLLAASIRLVVAQRLLRILCDHCKSPAEATHSRITEQFGITQHHVAVGCPHCHYTGYARRKAVYEVIPITRALSNCIKTMEFEVDDLLAESGIATLQSHVVHMIRTGETSLEEGMMYLI
ncbi:MAG: GspE/PulE family protein [Bacteroidota bacterium]